MTRALIGALIALGLFAWFQSWRVGRLEVENAALTAEAKAADQWRVEARDDAQRASDRCINQVAKARQSAQRIETIIERPVHVDPEGCAVRELVPAGQLRDALQPERSASE